MRTTEHLERPVPNVPPMAQRGKRSPRVSWPLTSKLGVQTVSLLGYDHTTRSRNPSASQGHGVEEGAGQRNPASFLSERPPHVGTESKEAANPAHHHLEPWAPWSRRLWRNGRDDRNRRPAQGSSAGRESCEEPRHEPAWRRTSSSPGAFWEARRDTARLIGAQMRQMT